MSSTTHDASLVRDAAAAGRVLVITSDGGAVRALAVPEVDELVIGRDADCAVVLEHVKVSRRHVRLHLEGDQVRVEDLGSRNGTMVRGARLESGKSIRIALGENIILGPFSIAVVPCGTALPPTLAGGSVRIDDPTSTSPSPLLSAIGASPVSLLILGETGAGKEVLAETIHRLSARPGPLLRINCAALSPTLLESELFGHERGAFTGAVQAKPGLLESAAGGTVLLDEIGEMPAPLQASLLRAIEAREVFRVGSVKPVAIDVRFVAATHRDLRAAVERGVFRRDLYYRLAGLTLEVPPLRERAGRVGALALAFVEKAAAAAGTPNPGISASALAVLERHDWPGNVRELRNVIDRALLLATGREIRPEHILFDTARAASGDRTSAAARAAAEAGGPTPPPVGDPAGEPVGAPPPGLSLAELAERARIIAALETCAGNQTRAAKQLGISRATLVTKLRLFNIPRPRGPRE